MPKRYRVAETSENGHLLFEYPADAAGLAMIIKAGGRSKLTKEQHELLKLKTVVSGEDCSDMPESSLLIYLERGWVVEVDEPKLPVKGKPVIAEVSNE